MIEELKITREDSDKNIDGGNLEEPRSQTAECAMI